jgi:hypothetical protein
MGLTSSTTKTRPAKKAIRRGVRDRIEPRRAPRVFSPRVFARRASGAMVLALSIAALSNSAAGARARAASDESDVRATVERAFSQLKGGDYGALYDVLPTAAQQKITRERFTAALERSRNLYDLDRLEIGAVRVANDLAVVDSIVYARARAPFEGDGKIVLRQYLVREGGRWRVTTGERATVQPLLAANPAFARKYPPTEPRVYVKRDGKWVAMNELMRGARGRNVRKKS